MNSTFYFTTDQHFRLVDTDPELARFLSVKKLKGDALDEYVTREDLPTFLSCIVDVFKGKIVKEAKMTFTIGKHLYQTYLDLNPVIDARGQITAIKGSVTLISDKSSLVQDMQETKDTQRGGKKAPYRSKNRPKKSE